MNAKIWKSGVALVALSLLAVPSWMTSHLSASKARHSLHLTSGQQVSWRQASLPTQTNLNEPKEPKTQKPSPAICVRPDVRRLERRARERWAKANPQAARLVARPGSYLEVAHLVARSDWNALKPVHRAMMRRLIAGARAGEIGVMPCFAPGTDLRTIHAFEGINNSLQFYRVGNYWSTTSSGPHVIGAPMTLRWSVVPDGTALPSGASGAGEPASVSQLRAKLNTIYGNEATWRAVFRQVFARWSEVSGVRYIEELNDDGSAITAAGTNAGAAGVRGDVRISGHPIDGTNNILAYNFFPNVGDMIIDTADMAAGAFFTDTSLNSLNLRNVATHEHGHGLGFAHVCPVNETKLMEPIVSRNFDGPQIDDIQNAQRGYGDPLEDNDSQAGGTDLGTLANGTVSRTTISLDGSSDQDFFRFSVAGSKLISANLRPVGGSYLEGPQNSDGSCSAGTTFVASSQRDLQLTVLNASGQIIAQADATRAGGSESLSATRLSVGTGPFSVRVSGDGADKVQLYNLDFTLSDAPSGASFTKNGSVVVNDTQGNGNNNGRPDPGESSLRLTIPLLNNGDVTATNVRATLTSLTPGVTVGQSNVFYGSMAINSTANNVTFPTIALSPSFSCGTTIQLRLDVQSDQGTSVVNFSVATGTAVQTTFSYTGAAVPIPDGVAANSPGNAATATITVSGSSSINDLNLGLENLAHTYVGDLVISLTSPAGTTVNVIDRIGNGQTSGPNFVNTVLDDEATSSIETVGNASAPYTGSYTPANPLSAFDGQNANGTWTLRAQDFYNGDTGTIKNFSLRITTLECGVPTPVSPSTSGAKISEFRLSGPSGQADEFIELYNFTDKALDMSGWSVAAGSLTITIPASTAPVPAYGRLLLTNSTATTGYSLASYAAGDVSFSGDIASGSVLQLRNPGLTVVDQVTSSALPAPLAPTDNYSYVRRLDGSGGGPLDTDNDQNDFNLVDVQSTTGPNTTTGISNGLLRLGAPGPENLSSPTTYNSLITLTLASTNRVGSGNSGTLGLRYVLTNKAGSGRTITSLRFRVVAATAGTSNPANPSGAAFAGPADLRLISSTSSDGTILPLLLQQPPTQPGGGGLNSTVSLATLPTGGLAPGASVTVEFLFNVIQRGNYRLLVNLEPLTIAAP